MFKGSVKVGVSVEAELSLDGSASGTAVLLVGHGAETGAGSENAVVAPGATGSAETAPTARGILRVVVDVSKESDGAQLKVTGDGSVLDDEKIQGDTTWTYAVT
jgi:hypothetical protein